LTWVLSGFAFLFKVMPYAWVLSFFCNDCCACGFYVDTRRDTRRTKKSRENEKSVEHSRAVRRRERKRREGRVLRRGEELREEDRRERRGVERRREEERGHVRRENEE